VAAVDRASNHPVHHPDYAQRKIQGALNLEINEAGLRRYTIKSPPQERGLPFLAHPSPIPADSTTLGHSAHDHLDTRSMLTWTPDPHPLGQAVVAQRRRFALLV
jgi:hypothetical protein